LTRLNHYFADEKDKTFVIEPGIDDDFRKLLSQESEPLVKQKYILSVSALYPHKKMLYLLDLWERLSKSQDLDLIVVGKNGLDEEKFVNKIESLSKVHYYPKVDYRSLVSLYKYASCFIFPSVYEGFGFPVYEAIAAKIPAIVGNKEIYLERIRPDLLELSFNINEDLKTIERALSSQQKIKVLTEVPNYETGVNKLIAFLTKSI